MKYHAKTYYYPGTKGKVVQDVQARQAYIDRGLIKPVNDNPGLVEAYKRQESGCYTVGDDVVGYGITGKMYRAS